MPRINIDITEMEDALSQMNMAIQEFKGTSQDAFVNEIGALGQMRSDFVDVYARILECAKGWGTIGLAENMESYYGDAKAILDTMIATDLAESKEIKEIASGRA